MFGASGLSCHSQIIPRTDTSGNEATIAPKPGIRLASSDAIDQDARNSGFKDKIEHLSIAGGRGKFAMPAFGRLETGGLNGYAMVPSRIYLGHWPSLQSRDEWMTRRIATVWSLSTRL